MVTRAGSSNSVKSVRPPPTRARVVYLVFSLRYSVRATTDFISSSSRRKSGRSEFLHTRWNIYPRSGGKKRKRSSFEGEDLFE